MPPDPFDPSSYLAPANERDGEIINPTDNWLPANSQERKPRGKESPWKPVIQGIRDGGWTGEWTAVSDDVKAPLAYKRCSLLRNGGLGEYPQRKEGQAGMEYRTVRVDNEDDVVAMAVVVARWVDEENTKTALPPNRRVQGGIVRGEGR